MLDSVISAAVATLTGAGLTAGPFYPNVPLGSGVTVLVGAEQVRHGGAALGQYLGLRPVPGQDSEEVYGLRCELDLRLDIYAPLSEENAALSCLAAFDTAAAALDAAGSYGITGLSCGVPEPDSASGCFHLRAGAACRMLLLHGGSGAPESIFTDYVLRGEPDS